MSGNRSRATRISTRPALLFLSLALVLLLVFVILPVGALLLSAALACRVAAVGRSAWFAPARPRLLYARIFDRGPPLR